MRKRVIKVAFEPDGTINISGKCELSAYDMIKIGAGFAKYGAYQGGISDELACKILEKYIKEIE